MSDPVDATPVVTAATTDVVATLSDGTNRSASDGCSHRSSQDRTEPETPRRA